MTITGGCLCGALEYELQGPVPSLVHCHCSMCRKHHGAPFASVVAVAPQSFRWLRGEGSALEFRSSAERVRCFCGVCGAVAPTWVGDRVLVPAGNLRDDLDAGQALHIFVGSKAPWHVIADGLPQHETFPPGWPVHEVDRPARAQPEGVVPGSCLCGAVSFSVSGAPSRWFQCHCSRCRRGRSAVHGSNAFYPLDQFAWRSGRELVRKYKVPEAQRFAVSFCERCGGGAPVEREGVPFILIPAALLDADPGVRPQAHIFVASGAPWYTVSDGLEQFAELPPS